MIIVGWREPSVVWFGLAGMAFAFFYHAPPFRLSYRGLGEMAVAVSYGPLVTAGTYLVQRGTIPTGIVLLSLPLGVLIAAFLWINEFPDYTADALSGKRTLVVRLGRAGAAAGLRLARRGRSGHPGAAPRRGTAPVRCGWAAWRRSGSCPRRAS